MSLPSRHARAATLFLCAASVFLLLLGRQDVANTHEARVAQTAREMAASGWPWRARAVEVPAARLVVEGGRKSLKADPAAPPLRVNPWVVPVLTGEIRLQKPPLPYWCAAILFRLFGEGPGAARLVPALMGAAATLLVYDLARRQLGLRAAPVAALLWVSSYFVVSEYRKAMADPYLAFFTLTCVWAWVRASAERYAARAKSSAAWLVIFYASLALGFLAKGPVVLVHVSVAAAAFHACYRRPLPIHPLGHVAGALILLAITLPWPLKVLASVPNALELWRYESVGELTDNRRNAAPFWAYLPNLPYLALPWTPLWAAALAYPFARIRDSSRAPARVRRRRHRLLFPLAWYGATVLFFSFVNLKKNAYLLPVMPAQTLLIAQLVRDALGLVRLRRLPRWFTALGQAQTILGAGAAAVTFALLAWQVKSGSLIGRVPLIIGAAVVAAAAVAAAPVRWRVLRQARADSGAGVWVGRWFAAEALACAAVVAGYVAVFTAGKENSRSPKPFADAVWRYVSEAGPDNPRAVRRSGLPPSVAFYLPLDTGREDVARRIVVVSGKNAKPQGVAADYTADTGWPVTEVRPVSIDEASDPDRWTVFELTLGNRRAFASSN